MVFNAKSDRITDAVRLLAAVGAVAADPTLLSALKSAPSAYDALKKIAAAPPPSVARLADTLAAEARALFAATRDLPPDADVLYVQMVEAGMVEAPEIIAARMEALAVTEAMVARLTDPEHRTGPMLALFRALTKPTLRRLLADKAFAADLTPAVFAGMLCRIADVSAKLDDIAGQSRETLEALALRFGEPEPEAMPLGALKGFLVEKAKDYRRLQAQVRALEERAGRIANLKAAAEDAVRALRLDEAKALIRDAIAVQRSERTLQALRDDAALVETEAEIALLENDADEAFRLLSGARRRSCRSTRRRLSAGVATIFSGCTGMACATVAPVSPGRWRSDDGTSWARRISRCLQLGLSADDLGGALSDQGFRVGGEAAAGLLGEAVAAFRAALRVWTEAAHPVDWAATQNNLGRRAFMCRAMRVGGEAGARQLGEAVAAYPCRAASPHRGSASGGLGDHAEQPRQRAVEHRARGRWEGGRRAARRGGGCLSRRAASLDRGGAPGELGDTQNNLGNALGPGRAVGGKACAGLFGEAVAAHRAALRVWTGGGASGGLGETQNNLGNALRRRARGSAGRRGSAARRGGGGLSRRAARPDRGSAPRGLGDYDR